MAKIRKNVEDIVAGDVIATIWGRQTVLGTKRNKTTMRLEVEDLTGGYERTHLTPKLGTTMNVWEMDR